MTTSEECPQPREPDRLMGQVDDCQVRLELENRVVAWEEPLRGTVYVVGGEKPRKVSIWISARENFGEVLGESASDIFVGGWTGVRVPAGEQVRFCFAPRWGWGTPVQRMRLTAVVRTGWFRNESMSAEILVVPPPCFRAVMDVLAELSGVPGDWSTLLVGDGLCTAFVPQADALAKFERLVLMIYRNNGTVYGGIGFHPVEEVAPGHRRKADPIVPLRIEFRIPLARLSEARSILEPLIRPVLHRMRRPHTLPIPSLPPVPKSRDLPIAAD